MLPVMVGIELSLFEKTEHLAGIIGADHRAKTNGGRVRRRNHNTQTAGKDFNHEVTFGSAIQDAVTDLFYNAYAVVRINDFVADLVFHSFGWPPGRIKSV